MKIKITKPEEMMTDLTKVEGVIEEFEEKFKGENKGENYYHLVISGEYDRGVCNEVEKIYSDAGWTGVRCLTSSERGERGGLTGLILNRK